MSKFLTAILALLTHGASAQADSLRLQCNVNEFTSATKSIAISTYQFDGSEQTPLIKLKSFTDMTLRLKGAPGAVSDSQAFYIGIRITDQTSQVQAVGQALFVKDQAYSSDFEQVIPGSGALKLTRGNGDYLSVWCFDLLATQP